MLYVQINGFTAAPRHDVVSAMSAAISAGGGWIVDHHLYSDLCICLNFQVEASKLETLWTAFQSLPVKYAEASSEAIVKLVQERASTDEEVTGTLEVTFGSGTGDLRRTVPSVPG